MSILTAKSNSKRSLWDLFFWDCYLCIFLVDVFSMEADFVSILLIFNTFFIKENLDFGYFFD